MFQVGERFVDLGRKALVLDLGRRVLALALALAPVAATLTAAGCPYRLCLKRDGLAGRIRTVGWRDEDTLFVFHNDYLEPEDDRRWAGVEPPVSPEPTASVERLAVGGSDGVAPGGHAAPVAPGGYAVPVRLFSLPWHSRVSAVGADKGGRVILGIFQDPLGINVEPATGSFVVFPTGDILASIPAGLRPLTVPGSEGRYLAVRSDGVGRRPFRAAAVPGRAWRLLLGRWTDGYCRSPPFMLSLSRLAGPVGNLPPTSAIDPGIAIRSSQRHSRHVPIPFPPPRLGKWRRNAAEAAASRRTRPSHDPARGPGSGPASWGKQPCRSQRTPHRLPEYRRSSPPRSSPPFLNPP